MKTPLLYGSLMALAGALVTYGFYFAGLHDTPEKLQSTQWIASVISVVAGIACMVLAMRERRAEFPTDREWGYGSAFGTGFLTGVFAAVFGAILAYIYFTFVNPQFSETLYQAQVAKMEQKGMSGSQIDAASGLMRKMLSPIAMTVFQILGGAVWSVILSLIIAIFFRRRELPLIAAETPPAVPPTA